MRETADLWAYEREAREQGYTAVCGVDEAGAGPLMGPVYAARQEFADEAEETRLLQRVH